MIEEKSPKNNTSWFTENWEEIRKELIKDVEKVNKLKKEVMKIRANFLLGADFCRSSLVSCGKF